MSVTDNRELPLLLRAASPLLALLWVTLLGLAGLPAAHADRGIPGAKSGFVDNEGVKLHYVTLGSGPLVVMIHGFPDYCYSWRHQMEGLADEFQVVAFDQRGYNRSSAPDGLEPYAMRNLVGDVAAVIRHFGAEKAIVVGHDWGGAVAWQFAYALPQMVDKLVILNLPHPNGLAREAATNAEARAGSSYVEVFRNGSPTDPNVFFGGPMTPQTLASWVTDKKAKRRYIRAFKRSNFAAMLAYYKMNYPTPPADGEAPQPIPALDTQVLMFHGLEDTALHSDALNNTWDWISRDLTLVTAPGAGHFVQQDAAELVTTTLRWWLLARP